MTTGANADDSADQALNTRSRSRPALTQSQVSKVRPAYQQVAEQLRDLILQGTLSSGDRLPPEFELAENFGVSRSTVREALRVLASRDLIHTTRGTTGGTFVSRIDFDQVSDYLETSLGLMSDANDVSLMNLLEARQFLEVPAAGLAAKRREQHHLDEMALRLEREKRTMGRGLRFREHRDFHGMVVEATGNPLLSVMTEPIFRVLQARMLHDGLGGTYWRKVHEDHTEIHDRIADGDSEGASVAMLNHLDQLKAAYRSTLGQA